MPASPLSEASGVEHSPTNRSSSPEPIFSASSESDDASESEYEMPSSEEGSSDSDGSSSDTPTSEFSDEEQEQGDMDEEQEDTLNESLSELDDSESEYEPLSDGEKASKKRNKKSIGGSAQKKQKSEAKKSFDVSKLKVSALQQKLKSRGLSTDGKKPALQKRLLKAMGPGLRKKKRESIAKEKARFKVVHKKMKKWELEKLKRILRLNGQKVSGTKKDLIERCTDGEMYGALPRCSKCRSGRLRVKYAAQWGHGGSGTFTCPGFFVDDEFSTCGNVQDSADRTKWKLK
eukprot:82361_1